MAVEPLTEEEHAALVAAKLLEEPLRYMILPVDGDRTAHVFDVIEYRWCQYNVPLAEVYALADRLNAQYLLKRTA